ncbi:T9SS type A sorting domain-containing protein [Flavobacterium soli]|uniref:T9SS type A sorting domain-containing protein n=1 Tax=Flavobacterium soli TaxID=344881 RepID=UPI00047C17F1|nr:T9SS type A sorting domain-containing protein [Flavobacterium soli]
MKKKFTLLIFFIATLQAQSLHAQQGTVAAGGESTGSGGSASNSIGVPVYTAISGSGGEATQGIQQPYEIYVLGTDEFESIRLSVRVYPNPTVSTAYLSFDSLELENIRFELYDLNGKLLKGQKVTSRETPIAMDRMPSTMYLLKVYSGNRTLKSFKILKRD